jgi:V-type H+-transporting ATPase subunit a
LLFKNGEKNPGQLKDVLPFRFILTMMGFFALYAGTLYNDFLSLTFNTFGSCYDPNVEDYYQPGVNSTNSTVDHVYPYNAECTYPYGLDPIWGKAGNDIVYINSFKMKFAVIVGVI